MVEPRLNIVYDSRRFEKYEPLIKELKRQKIKEYELWPCILDQSVVKSINLSHKMIVSDAKEKGLKEVCIGEDDLMFSSEMGWEYFLKNKPKEFDIYSGCNYLSFERPKEPGLVKFECIVGFHLYIVHESYYDKFLSVPDNDHIDTIQRSNNMYAMWPFCALQRPGFSGNNKSTVNYNVILSEADIYK